MAGKRIRGEICHAIHRYAKAHNEYMKSYNGNKKSIIIKIQYYINSEAVLK